MKALKEKRVSLRSLFRRSLVILSLLALAFAVASCGGSGGGTDEPDPSGPTGPSGSSPEASVEAVAEMQVLKHPYMPSFEGAMPDLTGLQVMVTWKKDGKVSKQEIVDDIAKFAVYPPVAYVKDAGTHVLEFSKRGQYAIQYNGDNYYDLSAYRVNVYIPAVIALDSSATSFATYATMLGTVGTVYEDEGVDAKGVKFQGKYVPFEYSTYSTATFTTDFPYDSYYTSADDLFGADSTAISADPKKNRWPDFDGTNGSDVIANPVSSDTEAWRIVKRPELGSGEKTKVLYLAGLNSPYDERSVKINQEVEAEKFYYVDRFNYISGADKINGGAILADDGDLGGPASDNTNDIENREKWWKALQKVGEDLKFEVTYYDPETGATGIAPKTITINDYVKAMFTPRGDYATTSSTVLTPRATLPALTGGGNATPTPRTRTGVTESIIYGYEDTVFIRLFYYHPKISGTVGKGIIDDADLVTATSSYETPNMATIPISDLIWTYSGLNKVRRDSTSHPQDTAGAPEIVSNAGSASTTVTGILVNGKSLYQGLMRYWDIVWEYENPKDPSAPLKQIPYIPTTGTYSTNGATGVTGLGKVSDTYPTWPKNTGTNATIVPGNRYFLETQTSLANNEGDLVFDNAVSEEDEIRQCTVQFLEPPSAASATGVRTRDEIEFDYIMKP